MGRTMRSARKAGTSFETAVCRFLGSRLGIHVERRRPRGRIDEGDVAGVVTPGGLEVAIECKAHATYSGKLGDWIDQACRERDNAGAQAGAVVFKRKSFGDGKMWGQYVLMTLEDFARLLGAPCGGDFDAAE